MNKDNIDLTFGIPMYNSENYIAELLKCFESTSYKYKYEILIVDDGSTDNSLQICKSFNNEKIRVIHKENGGVSSARNTIIENAYGKWITFIDSDDLINFDKYMDAYKFIKDNPADWLIIMENEIKNPTISFLIENEIINSPCMKLYNKDILHHNNIIFNNKYDLGEDLLFNLDYLNNIDSINYKNDSIYYYRKSNEGSLTNKYRNNKFKILMEVYEEACKKSRFKDYLKSFEYIRIKNSISTIKSELLYGKKDKNELRTIIKKAKDYKKIEMIRFTSIKKTMVYYLWYFLPVDILLFGLQKYYLRKR